VTEISRQLPQFDESDIANCLRQMLCEGDVFNTLDEEHFLLLETANMYE